MLRPGHARRAGEPAAAPRLPPEGKGAGLIATAMTFSVQVALLAYGVGWDTATVLFSASFFDGLLIVGPADRCITKLYGALHKHTGEVVTADHNRNCWDEVVGQFALGPMVFFMSEWLPPQHWGIQALWLLIGALFFRLFDVKKPLGIRFMERRMGSGG